MADAELRWMQRFDNFKRAQMAMLQDRNRTVHTYNESTANEIIAQIEQIYAGLFSELELTFNHLNISD